jgi:hypothetical protein
MSAYQTKVVIKSIFAGQDTLAASFRFQPGRAGIFLGKEVRRSSDTILSEPDLLQERLIRISRRSGRIGGPIPGF